MGLRRSLPQPPGDVIGHMHMGNPCRHGEVGRRPSTRAWTDSLVPSEGFRHPRVGVLAEELEPHLRRAPGRLRGGPDRASGAGRDAAGGRARTLDP